MARGNRTQAILYGQRRQPPARTEVLPRSLLRALEGCFAALAISSQSRLYFDPDCGLAFYRRGADEGVADGFAAMSDIEEALSRVAEVGAVIIAHEDDVPGGEDPPIAGLIEIRLNSSRSADCLSTDEAHERLRQAEEREEAWTSGDGAPFLTHSRWGRFWVREGQQQHFSALVESG